MIQKKCPQCKNLMSLDAPTCLYCGRPNKFATNYYVKRKWDKEYKKNKNIFKVLISREIFFFYILILLILFMSLFK